MAGFKGEYTGEGRSDEGLEACLVRPAGPDRGVARGGRSGIPVTGDAGDLRAVGGCRYRETMTISTLRFSARPLAVALSPMGLDSPNPLLVILSALVAPFSRRYVLTAAARFSDRVWLYASLPWESV